MCFRVWFTYYRSYRALTFYNKTFCGTLEARNVQTDTIFLNNQVQRLAAGACQVKKKIKRGVEITEKSHETRRNNWGD